MRGAEFLPQLASVIPSGRQILVLTALVAAATVPAARVAVVVVLS